MKSKVLVATTLLLLGTVTSAYSGVCESANSAVAGTTAAAAALWATPPAVVATTGTAALEHSSGSYILSSVGIGGTGYIALCMT